MRERLKEAEQQERRLYKRIKEGYLVLDLTVFPQMECPENQKEIFFPIDYGEGILERTREILEEIGGAERGVFPGLIKSAYLPPNWMVPVQIIRAFIPGNPNKKTELAIKLSNSKIAFTSPERGIFSAHQWSREEPEI